MEILLTAPPNVAEYAAKNPKKYPGIAGIYSDPVGQKLGSGGGTVNVLWQHYLRCVMQDGALGADPGFGASHRSRMQVEALRADPRSKIQDILHPESCIGNAERCPILDPASFSTWLSKEKRLIIHSDGQSRRLPAYSTVGKGFIPFPVFKWGRGQRIDQTLFDVQRPLLERILEGAPAGMNTLVTAGDALVWTDQFRERIPQADVVCIGIWAQPEVAVKHGVFVCPRNNQGALEYMLQKPSLETLQSLTEQFLYLLDAGIWLLSDRAVIALCEKSGTWNVGRDTSHVSRDTWHVTRAYDLYSEFGALLGAKGDGKLSVAIVPLEGAEFYHFGSNSDLLKSTSALHNRVMDQREIWHKKIKPSPDIFVQNSRTAIRFDNRHSSIWIENSDVPEGWKLHDHHIVTGVPVNDWKIELPAGICVDFVPVGKSGWCIRTYGFNDVFRGTWDVIRDTWDVGRDTLHVTRDTCGWMNEGIGNWFGKRGFTDKEMKGVFVGDIYDYKLFPVVEEGELREGFVQWIVGEDREEDREEGRKEVREGGREEDREEVREEIREGFRRKWLRGKRLSAGEVIRQADLGRIAERRDNWVTGSLEKLAENAKQSIFYQLDLKRVAEEFWKRDLKLPGGGMQDTGCRMQDVGLMNSIHDLMFRSVYYEIKKDKRAGKYRDEAFTLLREGMLERIKGNKLRPVMSVKKDQILWGRSPLRLDLAGGWTDTPPYCILYGGSVVNMAVELNGQPPIQVYIRPTDQNVITIHSIDLGLSEIVRSYEDIDRVSKVGSAFAIPKASLKLAGFHPRYSSAVYKSLEEHLKEFGGGLDISLMVAVPKGSGLGTSSVLAGTILAGLSDFCTLGWDKHETAFRTLLLEQILTTGGGWQDQVGGLFEGVKLIESAAGLVQKPRIRWAPEQLFTRPETSTLILLYYTGITRVAKHILTDIVQGMFLNSSTHLGILSEMKTHARDTYGAIQNHDWDGLTSAIAHSWELNQRLDSGTNPPEIAAIVDAIKDQMASCKLLGAGGGGYLMIFAKDLQCANRIKAQLNDSPPNPRARFVDWSLSGSGLEITKS